MNLPDLAKRIVVVLIASFILLLSFPAKAHAQENPLSLFIAALNTLSSESTVANMTTSLLKTGVLVIFTCQDNFQCPEEFKTGALNIMGVFIAGAYTHPPASGISYLTDVKNRLQIVQPAYAQAQTPGTGFGALEPILPIWRAFRDFAYLIFVIIFIVIGFAIMFRFKISPQAVITIQSSLPRIIVALLLVTFSYAIVGFMIDLLYVILSLLILVLNEPLGAESTALLQDRFLRGDIISVFSTMAGIVPTQMWQALAGIGAAIGGLAGAFGAVANLTGIPGILAGGGIGIVIGLLVVGLLLFYLAFKIFIELVKAYFGILLAVIFAPLQLLLGALPLQGVGVGSWFKGLLVNILIFPGVASVLIVAHAIGQQLQTSPRELWSAPMLVGGSTDLIGALVAIGGLLIAHQVPHVIRQAFKAEGVLGAALAQTIGGPLRIGESFAGASLYTSAAERAARQEGVTPAKILARFLGLRYGPTRRI